ncbi:hypothetical protein ACFO3H_00515 [Halorussus sp. GCM10023401]|nr:hypothetical protein [Halorussus vallis]
MITSKTAALGSTVLAASGGGIDPTLLLGVVIVAIVIIAIAWVLTSKKGAD